MLPICWWGFDFGHAELVLKVKPLALMPDGHHSNVKPYIPLKTTYVFVVKDNNLIFIVSENNFLTLSDRSYWEERYISRETGVLQQMAFTRSSVDSVKQIK